MSAAAVARSQVRQPRDFASPRDHQWFASLYERSVHPVYRYASMLLRDAQSAEDLCAEVYLRAWRVRESYRGEGSELSWLLGITHNLGISLLRARASATRVLPFAMDRVDGSADDPAVLLAAGPDNERLAEALTRLTDEQRQVVFLRFFEGLSHDEVARRLSMNANAVRAVQFRALHRLRILLEVRGAATA